MQTDLAGGWNRVGRVCFHDAGAFILNVSMKRNRLTHPFPFAHLTGCGIKVGVVDSGIDATHSKIGRVAGGVDLSMGLDGQALQGTDTADCAGHGTACAGIIRRKAPETDLYSIRIFDASLSTDERALSAAIDWATAHQLDVVNLSLGTTDVSFRDAIAKACRKAVEAGTIVVAAAHNEGLESYPASLADVIGVEGGKVYSRYEYDYRPGERIECVARGDEQRVCWSDGREIMIGGTSYAAPHITGIVTLIREAHPRAPLETVREILKSNAVGRRPERVRNSIAITGSPFVSHAMRSASSSVRPGVSGFEWIKKAALYPYNKEMHAFIRFQDLLHFEIVGIADPVGKGLVGKDAGAAIGMSTAGIKIKPRLKDALKGADTLILGYVDRLGRIAKRDVVRESIQMAMSQGLHVFSFLPVPRGLYGDLYTTARKKGLRIFYPSISQGRVQDVLRNYRTDGSVEVPVVGVFGTSAQQGKFTVQLALRRKLIEIGYKVGQIGTEHHAELFGMDLAFPIGYASPLELPLQVYPPYLDHEMREICTRKKPEIVLVGAQSGTIPYDILEHATHSLPTLAFLLGTKPDACILVVNSIDPDDYIQDTINAIHSLGKTPTILLAMSDKEKHIRAAYGRTLVAPRQMSREEIDQKLHYLEERFRLPAAEIASEEGQQRIVDAVIGQFREKGPGGDEAPDRV